jgi:hypothetical protein
MTASGHVVSSQTDEVIFGSRVAQAVADLARRGEAERVSLTTAHRETERIARCPAWLSASARLVVWTRC